MTKGTFPRRIKGHGEGSRGGEGAQGGPWDGREKSGLQLPEKER